MAPTTIDTETELSAVNSILGAIGQSPVTTLGTVEEITGEVTYTGDGSDKTFEIVSSFTSSSEIKATVAGDLTTAFTISGSVLTFNTAPPNGASIRIYREREIANTFANPEVSFIYNILKECNVDVQNEGWNFNMENHVEFFPDSITKKIKIPDNVLRLDVTNGWATRKYNVVKRDGFLYDKHDHTDDWTEVGSILLDVVYVFPFSELPSAFKRYITAKASTRAATQLVANGELTKLLSQQEALGRASVMEYECNQGQHSMLGFPEDSSYTTYQPYRSLAR